MLVAPIVGGPCPAQMRGYESPIQQHASCLPLRSLRLPALSALAKGAVSPWFGMCLGCAYRPGAKINFCTRQFNNSATYSSFSDGHAIS